MTIPTAEVSIAFSTNPLAAPSWTVIQQPRSFSTKRTRSPQLGRFESGTFDGVFGNTDRSLEPLYASGANYPNVRVRKRLRLRATFNAVTYPVYDGFLESIKPTYPAKGIDAVASLSASDAFRIFAGYQLAVPYQAEVLKDSPAGYWQFNETTGAVTAADSSGNSNNGAYSSGGITFGVVDPITDNINGAITLDGSSGFVTIPTSFSVSGTAAFSLEAWVRNTVAGGAPFVISGSDVSVTSLADLSITAAGYAEFRVVVGGVSYVVLSASPINDGAWHHLVGTRDGSGNLVLYVDGASSGTGGGASGSLTPMRFLVGAYYATYGSGLNFMNGSIDEVAIWTGSALSSGRVSAHYNARTAYLGDTADGRVTTILNTVGWPSADRDLSAGVATLGSAGDLGGKKALDHLRDVDGTEAGALFMSRDGKVTFRNRHAVQGGTSASSTSQMTFGDGGGAEVPFTDLVIAVDDKEFANQVTVSRNNGISSTAIDSASVTKYGAQTYSRSSLAGTDADSISLSQWLLMLLKDPNKLRFETITVTLDSPTLTNAAIAAVLSREIWDRVTVAFQPPGGGARINQDVIVTGISHKVKPSRWDVDFQVSGTELGYQMFILNDATLGVLTTGTGRLGF